MDSGPAWKPRTAAPCLPAAAPRDANASPSAPATATNLHSGWPRQRRLLRRPEFRAAYSQGLRVSSRHFTLFGLARPPASAPGAVRFGITVSRKLGKAVVRNRIRRRTREILRRLDPAAVGSGPWNIVVNPRPSVANADLPRLSQELAEQLRRLLAALSRRPAPPPCA